MKILPFVQMNWFRIILYFPVIGLFFLLNPQPSSGLSFFNQPDAFIAKSQDDSTEFIQWTKSKSILSGQFEVLVLDEKTLKIQSSNLTFSGIQNRSGISLNLSDGRIITGSLHNDKLTLDFPSQDGMLEQVEFIPGTIEEYNQKVSEITSKKNTISAYNHFVSLLNDVAIRLKALPNFDTPHPSGLQERYGSIVAKMRSDYQKGAQAIQMTSNCFRRESIKSYTLTHISVGYTWANTAKTMYRNKIQDIFENDIKKIKMDLERASQEFLIIQNDRRSKNYVPALQNIDLSKYFQEFTRKANGQVMDAVLKFKGVREKMALYDEEAKRIYDRSQQEFHFQVCYP